MKPEQITSIRKYFGYGYESFGKLMNPPVDKQTVKLLERGDLAISDENAQKILYLSGVVDTEAMRLFEENFYKDNVSKEYLVVFNNDQDFQEYCPEIARNFLGYAYFHRLAFKIASFDLANLKSKMSKDEKVICQLADCLFMRDSYEKWLHVNHFPHLSVERWRQ